MLKWNFTVGPEDDVASASTSALAVALGAPLFNTFTFDACIAQGAFPVDDQDLQKMTRVTHQPNASVFEQDLLSPLLSVTSTLGNVSSSVSTPESDDYVTPAAALFIGHYPLLLYALRSNKDIFTAAVNRMTVIAETKTLDVWSAVWSFLSGTAAVRLVNPSFHANFVEAFEDQGFDV